MKKSLVALSLGTLGFGIAEYVMMGILPDIAGALGVSIPRAGHFISAYALGVCVGAPLLAVVGRRLPLRKILLVLVVIYAAGNLGAALSGGYWPMVAARFVSGLPHGGFFGVGAIVAEKLADRGRESQAVSAIIFGITVANLVGVPFGTYVSNYLSWRDTFFIAAAWGAVVFLAIRFWVPRLAPLPDTGLKNQFGFLKRGAPWLLIAATMLGNAGLFCWYSYVSPVMTRVSGFTANDMTMIMVLAGAGMCAGNLMSGRLSDRFMPGRVAAVTQGIMAAALLLIFFFARIPWASLTLMTVCTACLFALSTPEQVLLIGHSGGGQLLGAASAQVAFNLGNAIGAWCGAIPVRHGLGYEYTALPGVAFALIGFSLLVWFRLRYEREKTVPHPAQGKDGSGR